MIKPTTDPAGSRRKQRNTNQSFHKSPLPIKLHLSVNLVELSLNHHNNFHNNQNKKYNHHTHQLSNTSYTKYNKFHNHDFNVVGIIALILQMITCIASFVTIQWANKLLQCLPVFNSLAYSTRTNNFKIPQKSYIMYLYLLYLSAKYQGNI